jgi:hypothetical protein
VKKEGKTLLAVVLFPGCEAWLSDLFTSIEKQSNNSFDLLILNEGIITVPQIRISGTIWHEEASLSATPGSNRNQIIQFAKEYHYENLLFADADDTMKTNRIEKTLERLIDYDFVCSDLAITDAQNKIIAERMFDFGKDRIVDTTESVLNCNYLGMSSAGIRINALAGITIPADLIAVDWWLFSVLLLNGFKGLFLQSPLINYRQHSSNTAGSTRELTESSLIKGIEVKIRHYSAMVQYCKKHAPNQELAYQKRLTDMEELKKATDDKGFCLNYLGTVNKISKKPYEGWWNSIISINEFKQYGR